MALQNVSIDPAATALTPDDIVAGVNAATTDITRAGAVDPVARPIEPDEITTTEIATGTIQASDLSTLAVRDSLLGLPPGLRRFIASEPASGEHVITRCKRLPSGFIDFEYDDVPEV